MADWPPYRPLVVVGRTNCQNGLSPAAIRKRGHRRHCSCLAPPIGTRGRVGTPIAGREGRTLGICWRPTSPTRIPQVRNFDGLNTFRTLRRATPIRTIFNHHHPHSVRWDHHIDSRATSSHPTPCGRPPTATAHPPARSIKFIPLPTPCTPLSTAVHCPGHPCRSWRAHTDPSRPARPQQRRRSPAKPVEVVQCAPPPPTIHPLSLPHVHTADN